MKIDVQMVTTGNPVHVASINAGVFGNDDDDTRSSMFIRESIMNIKNDERLAIFLLMTAMLGAGILNQPYVFSRSGIAFATGLFLICAVFNWLGIICLVEVGVKLGKLDYGEIGTVCFGKTGDILVNLVLICMNFGAVLSYVNIMGSLLANVFNNWGCQECNVYLITTLLMLFIVFPLCTYKHMGKLSWISSVFIGVLISVCFLVIIGGPLTSSHVGQNISAYNSAGYAQLGAIVFALSCTFSSFHVFKSMTNRTKSNWRYTSFIANFTGALLCIIVGIFGYISFGADTDSIIIMNFTSSYADFFKILIIISLMITTPVYTVSIRYCILKLFGIETGNLESVTFHAIFTFAILFIVTLIALLLRYSGLSAGSAFSLINNFTGGISGSLAGFVLPAAFYLKVMTPDKDLYYPSVLMLIFGIFIFFYVPIVTIMDFVHSN